jgi:uncharacterized protein YndB with AHSA1/START domain
MKWILRIGGGLLGVILLAVIVLLVMGSRSTAGSVQTSVEINASPEQVWPWLHEHDKVKQWVSWLVEVRPVGPVTSPVGSKEVWVMRDENNGGKLMEITGTCTEYVPHTRLGVAVSTPGMFDGNQAYRLIPLDGSRTRLEVTGHYTFHMWWAKLLEPLITPSAKKKLDGDLARLQTLAAAR